MTAITLTTSSHIRRIDLRRDLLAVADLIEVCFSSTLDEDGREYLRHLRWTARDLGSLMWLQGAAERIASPLFGFVWEENGRIIGNLSLIPLNRGGRLVYLIANVAVHPDYRQRGIGRELTYAALEHLRQRGIQDAWLQVRDDNPVAYHLYRSLGFVERSRRTTWQSQGVPTLNLMGVDGVEVTGRRRQEWELQKKWLKGVYPPEVAWNLPISFGRISTDPLQQVMRWLRGEPQEHWAARVNGRPIGFLTWEPMRASSDVLWFAAEESNEERAVLSLLPHARIALARRNRALSLNYPAGRGRAAFLRAGFIHHQTLVWMQALLR